MTISMCVAYITHYVAALYIDLWRSLVSAVCLFTEALVIVQKNAEQTELILVT